MGLYTDPNYFEKQAHYQHRKVKKVIKAVSSKPKQITPSEAAVEATPQIKPEFPVENHIESPQPRMNMNQSVLSPSVSEADLLEEFDDTAPIPEGKRIKYSPEHRICLKVDLPPRKQPFQQQNHKKQRSPETHILLAALKPIFYVAVIGIGAYALVHFYNVGVENTPEPNPEPPTSPITVTNKENGPTVSFQPKNIYNGQMVTWPSGDQVAPLTVSTSGDTNYYIVLKPIDGEARSNGGMSFLVTGTSAEVDVPLGTYAIYYACGSDWYGKAYKFGEQTEYFKCNETFEFTSDGEMVYGWTLTLYKVSNGNMTTDEVPESSFPDI